MKVLLSIATILLALWETYGYFWPTPAADVPVAQLQPVVDMAPVPPLAVTDEQDSTPEQVAADRAMANGFFAQHYYITEILFFVFLLGLSGTTVITTLSYNSAGGFTGYSNTYVPSGSSGAPMSLGVIVLFGLLYWFVIRRAFSPDQPGVIVGHVADFFCHLFYVMIHWFM